MGNFPSKIEFIDYHALESWQLTIASEQRRNLGIRHHASGPDHSDPHFIPEEDQAPFLWSQSRPRAQ